MAWNSFLQSEGTGTPWNPPIWPVKMAIPIAGLLLLLQGIVNLLRDLGMVPRGRDAPHEHRAAEHPVRRRLRRSSCSPACRWPSRPARWPSCSPYVLFGLPGLTLVISRVFTLMGNYVLVSVPLFIFMACILERAGIAEAIFRAVHVWFGRRARRPGRRGHHLLRADGGDGRRDRRRDRHHGRDRAAGDARARLQEGHRARQHLRRRRTGDAHSAQRRLHPLRPDRRASPSASSTWPASCPVCCSPAPTCLYIVVALLAASRACAASAARGARLPLREKTEAAGAS